MYQESITCSGMLNDYGKMTLLENNAYKLPYRYMFDEINNELIIQSLMPMDPADVNDIKNVIFNKPATIVFWKDGTKTVVKCSENDIYDPEKGLAMAVLKKYWGENFKKTFAKWVPEEKEETDVAISPANDILDVINDVNEQITQSLLLMKRGDKNE